MKPSARRKIGLLALVAATYAMVAGGPFGLEEIVAGNGYSRAILILCLTPLLWAVPSALMVSELASALPETGGFYVWVRRALGPFWGFQESWLSFAGSIFDMAIYPILFAAYLAHLVPALGQGRIPFAIGALMILACVLMNLFGTRFVGENSIVFVLFLLAPFAFLIWHGMIWHGTASPPLTAPALTRSDALGGVLIAMWNYMGWDNASTIAGDVRNAPRTYSRAMGITLVVVVATYIAPILAVAHARVPLSAWETGSWVTLAALFGGQRLALFMTAAAVAAALSTFNALVLSLSRLPYAMARDGFLPHVFARENRRGAPWVAIVVCAVCWACAMRLGFERTVMLDVLLTGLSILLEFAALIALRIKEPDLPRPFRVAGGALGLVLITTPPTILILISCARNRAEQIGSINALTVGAAIVLAGVIVYFFGPRRRTTANGNKKSGKRPGQAGE
ncbi:MAG: APC family permease [Candidatus Korobacteraceae bacterium]